MVAMGFLEAGFRRLFVLSRGQSNKWFREWLYSGDESPYCVCSYPGAQVTTNTTVKLLIQQLHYY